MKNLIISIIAILSCVQAHGQLITDADAGSANVTTPTLQDGTEGNTYSINPFSGLLSVSRPLGTVRGKDGLSFSLSLDYSSTISTGSTNPNIGGILYGKGWNLNIPMVTIQTEDYHKYTYGDTERLSQSTLGNLVTTVFNRNPDNQDELDSDCEEALLEGKLFWYSPVVSLPGIGSSKLVFKEYDQVRGYKFVPHSFERYFECFLQISATELPTWTAVLGDGTTYKFQSFSVRHQAASNQRVQTECLTEENLLEVAKNLLLPKSVISEWYCVEISHPLRADNIDFHYSQYGNFDSHHHGIYTGKINTDFFSNSKDNFLATTYKRVVLDKIDSDLEELELAYDHLTEEVANFNLPGQSDAIDNMFAEHVDVDFPFTNDWHRYLHGKSAALGFCANIGNGIANGSDEITNPYNYNRGEPFGPNTARQDLSMAKTSSTQFFPFANISTYDVDLDSEANPKAYYDGGYLESPEINLSNLVPGDMYKLEYAITGDAFGDSYDVNITTGDEKIRKALKFTKQGSKFEYVHQDCYRYGMDQSLFSTFHEALKPQQSLDGHTLYFNLRSLPTSKFSKLWIKIGPGNSDNDFGSPEQNVISIEGTYFNLKNETFDDIGDSEFKLMNSGAKTPYNFGAGVPWYILYKMEEESNLVENWWKTCAGNSNPSFPVLPNSAVINPALKGVKLIRIFERPYQLQTVTKRRKNTSNSLTVVSKVGMEYEGQTLRREAYWATTDRVNSDQDQTNAKFDGNRYEIHLKKIKVLDPTETSTYESSPEGNPTYHFAYQKKSYSNEFDFFDPQFASNFFVLHEVTSPLGNTQTIEYFDPSFDFFIGETLNSPAEVDTDNSKSLVINNIYKRKTFWKNPTRSLYNNLPCGNVCNNTNPPNLDRVNVPAPEVAFTVHMFVKSVSSADATGPKVTDYDYISAKSIFDSHNLTENLFWDGGMPGAYKFGFTNVRVTSSAGADGLRPYTVYEYHADTEGHLYGKQKKIETYTGDDVLTSRSDFTYSTDLVFDADWTQGATDQPDFIALANMYDAPLFYATRYKQDSYKNNSYFVKLDEMTSTSFLNGAEIEFKEEYSYFDLDLSNTGYSELGITSLTKEPSFQKYKTIRTSPQDPTYSEVSEAFCLYDLANGGLGNSASATAFQHGVRGIPFQIRTTVNKYGSSYSNSTFTTYFPSSLVGKASHSQVSDGTYVGLYENIPGSISTVKNSEINSLNQEFLKPTSVTDVMGRTTTSTYYPNGNLNSTTTTAAGLGSDLISQSVLYFANNDKIRQVTDQNNIVMAYSYDHLNRLETESRNGTLLSQMTHSNWENDLGTTLVQRAQQNYMETISYVGSGQKNTKKEFVNTEGNYVGATWENVVVEDLILDVYGRVSHQKPPSIGDFPSLSSNSTAADRQFEYLDHPLDIMIKSSELGLDITSKPKENIVSYVSASALSSFLASSQTSYSGPISATLKKVRAVDEDGKYQEQYMDIHDNLLVSTTGNSTAVTTFLYDERNNLTKYTGPEGVQTDFSYNYLGQMYKRESVDLGIELYAYDIAGHLIGKKTAVSDRVFGYDNLGRTIYEATSSDASFYDNQGSRWVTADSDFPTINSLTNAAVVDYLTKFYYDSYSSEIPYENNIQLVLNDSPAAYLKNKVAQSISYNNDGDPISSAYYIYNFDGEIYHHVSQINDAGITSANTGYVYMMTYTYTDNGLLTNRIIDVGADFTYDFNIANVYDSRGRLSEVKARYALPSTSTGPAGAPLPTYTVAKYTYDDITNLVDYVEYFGTAKNIEGECGQNGNCIGELIDVIDYTYNDRYMTTRINSNLFEQMIAYDNNNVANGSSGQNFNGNVNSTAYNYKFNSPALLGGSPAIFSNLQRGYAFTYDDFNRLETADSESQNIASLPNFDGSLVGDTRYQYSKAGNIENLVRTNGGIGQTMSQSYTYTYANGSNKLNVIQRTAGNGLTAGPQYYAYDGSGNITADQKSAITDIVYYRENLPYRMEKSNSEAYYNYDFNHQRVTKSVIGQDDVNTELYIKDYAGVDIGVYNVSGDNITWYVSGLQQIAYVENRGMIECDGSPTPGGNTPIGDSFRKVDELSYAPYFHSAQVADITDLDSHVENQSALQVVQDLIDRAGPTDKYAIPNTISVDTLPDLSVRYRLANQSPAAGTIGSGNIAVSNINQMLPFWVNGRKLPISLFQLLDSPPPSHDPEFYQSFAVYGSSVGHPLGGYNPGANYSYTYTLPVQADYYIQDHLGSTRLTYHILCSGTGSSQSFGYKLSSAYDYFPFGEFMKTYEENEEKFAFTGKERDRETGYDYFGARYYDSEIGRFMSVDPLADKYTSWSPYTYTLNNPNRYIDPDGREVIAPNQASQNLVLSSVQYMFGKNHGYSFDGNKLIHNGTAPTGMSSGQTTMYNYFNSALVNSDTKTTVLANQDMTLMSNGKLAKMSSSAAATTFGTDKYTKIAAGDGSYEVRVGFPAENKILVPTGTVKNGTGVETIGGMKSVGADHVLSHEFGHAIVNTIMNEFGGSFNGVDFNKMSNEERSDWAIRYTNTLFKQGSNDQETGGGQHGRAVSATPKGTLDPIKN